MAQDSKQTFYRLTWSDGPVAPGESSYYAFFTGLDQVRARLYTEICKSVAFAHWMLHARGTQVPGFEDLSMDDIRGSNEVFQAEITSGNANIANPKGKGDGKVKEVYSLHGLSKPSDSVVKLVDSFENTDEAETVLSKGVPIYLYQNEFADRAILSVNPLEPKDDEDAFAVTPVSLFFIDQNRYTEED